MELFVANKNCSNGREGACKACAKIRKGKHRTDNLEHYIAREKAYYQEHVDHCRIINKTYYEKNKSKILIQCKRYYEAHKEYLKLKAKEWYEANKERLRAKNITKYKANRKEILRKQREQRKRHPEQFQQWYKNYYAKHKKIILARRRKYRQTERGRMQHNRSGKKDRDELADHYVRWQLYCHKRGRTILSKEDIPQELIELKREHIKLGRALKALA